MKYIQSISSNNFIRNAQKVNYITMFSQLLLLKSLAANVNEICEDKINSVCHESSKISSIAKMRWKQLARNAFNQSIDQKIKQKSSNNSNSIKSQSISLNHNSNGYGETFLNKNNILDLISLNTPAPEDILSCDRIENWVQLSGHDDSFALAGPGTIWKKRSSDSTEVHVYELLMNEPIAEMIPKFYRDVEYKGDNFIELEDLLYNYKDASIMDIKMGTRTFLESEVKSSTPRNDLYEKMIKIDPNAPTEEEHQARAVTKLRYMRFREALSSSSNLGFRIEGFKVGKDLKHNKNLHMIKRREDVKQTLKSFFKGKPDACLTVVDRLRTLMKLFQNSTFFQRHEVVGSSLLIIHTPDKAGVWMIDFAKTIKVPDNIQINHRRSWSFGNHEDGYLLGLDNLIQILEELAEL